VEKGRLFEKCRGIEDPKYIRKAGEITQILKTRPRSRDWSPLTPDFWIELGLFASSVNF
jgi:hypothetical protein